MENIRLALERARQLNNGRAGRKESTGQDSLTEQLDSISDNRDSTGAQDKTQSEDFSLDLRHLESNRVLAYDDTDFRSKSFDMLRTQVLQSMDQKNWKVLGITSPSPGCGKTVTAINLAFSIGRDPERSALLVDLDLQKPQVGRYLGMDCRDGVVSVLQGQTGLSNAIVGIRAGSASIRTLLAETSVSGSSAYMTSRAMVTMLQDIKREYSQTVILDLPPMLSSDDVIAVLPQLDCILLVAAVGKSTVAEIEECNKHLHSAAVVRFVLNKVPRFNSRYYTY